MAHLPFRRVILASAFHPGNGTRVATRSREARIRECDLERFQVDSKIARGAEMNCGDDSSRNSTAIEENFDAAS